MNGGTNAAQTYFVIARKGNSRRAGLVQKLTPIVAIDPANRERNQAAQILKGRSDGELALVGHRHTLRPSGRDIHRGERVDEVARG